MRGMKQVFVTKLTDVDLTDKEGIGSLRQEGEKWYKYCKILNSAGTVAGGLGSLVSYKAAGGALSFLVCIRVAEADAAPIAAGTLQGAVAGVSGTSYFGWVQTKGPAVLDTAVTSGAAGSGFTMTTTDKTATVALAAAVVPYVGVSVNATTGVILDCPF